VRKLLGQIQGRFETFVRQRDNVALVVSFSASDALPMLTMVEGTEANSASDMFWTFTDAFTDEGAYVEAIVNGFAAKHEGVRLALEKEAMAPWPVMPPQVLDANAPPHLRLRHLAAFSRELLPIPNGGNVVWTFFPLEIADPSAYATLLQEVLLHEFPNPWCHHLRFIIRDDPAARAIHEHLAEFARIDWYEPDLGPQAIRRGFEEAADDETLSLDERLGSVMVLAGIDQAARRHDDALEKYALLLQYHAPLGNLVMAAVALNGMGETYEKLGDLERANDSYQSALTAASHGEHPSAAVLLNIVFNLANLRYMEQRWAEAEAYYDLAQQLATVARNGPARVQALDFRGICQRQQSQLQNAEASWYAGSVIAAQLEDAELCRMLVGRLRQHYEQTGQLEKERERREQLIALNQQQKG
jgi:tetratricopeptide (TPR) repeat protein